MALHDCICATPCQTPCARKQRQRRQPWPSRDGGRPLAASSNGVSPATGSSSSSSSSNATKPVLETHAWDTTFSKAAQLTHSYRGPKLPVPPTRLRIFSGTSNPVGPPPLPAKISDEQYIAVNMQQSGRSTAWP